MPDYYLHRDGQNHGPYSNDQMKQFLTSGQVARNELICPEGGSEWVPASTLFTGSAPRPLTGAPATALRSTGNRALAITQEQVAVACRKVATPLLGMLFSVALPFLLWAVKSDAERGVRTSGKHRALKELAKENTDLLPIAIVIGLTGAVICAVWFSKSLKRARFIKAEFNRQQMG